MAPTPASLALLHHLDSLGVVAADHWWNDGAAVHLVLTKAEIDTLTDHGIDVPVGKWLKLRAERDDIGVVRTVDSVGGLDFTSGFVTGYLDSAELDTRIGAIAAAHPAWCSIIILPHATHGYDGAVAGLAGPATVRALRITSDPTVRSRPGFLLVGGMHAREWMNPLVVLEFAEQLLANVDPASTEPAVVQATRIVTEGDVLCVPVCNPDGMNFSVYDDAGWRKNRRPPAAPGDCPGVDDNRNFPVYFGGPGSSASEVPDSFRIRGPIESLEEGEWLHEFEEGSVQSGVQGAAGSGVS